MKKIAQEQKYIVLTAPVREGSGRPHAGWSEGETSPLKILFIYLSFILQASAKLAAEQAERMVKDSIAASMERIKNENESMRNWEENMVRRSGYTVDGKSIHREAVVDSSLGHTYYEGQSVHYYEDFYDAGPKITVSFSKEMLNGLTSSAIMLLVEQANLDIENWTTDIFGKVEKDDEGNSTLKQNYIARDSGNNSKIDAYKKLAKKDYDSLNETEQKEFDDLSELIVTVRDGKLGEWIGYAPQFKNGKDNAGNEDKNNKDLGMDLSKGRDWNIKHSGSGQMGKIMLDFQWNNMIEQQGWQKVALPAYDQPLWRGNGSWFEPPTIRGISSIVFEVVGTASGQKWFSYADDVIFAAIDLGGGFKSPEQVGLELAKTAATAVISMGCSAAGSAIGNVAGKAMEGAGKFANFAAQAGISMATSYATSVGTSFVNNWNLDADGKLAFDAESFGKSTYSAQTIAGSVGAGVTAGLGELNLKDANNKALNSNTFKTSEIKAMNNLAGGLVQNGVLLAMGGDATFNILDFADIAGMFGKEYKNGKTGAKASTGLLEVSFGKNGFKSRIGMGGTNISYSSLNTVLKGIKESEKVTQKSFGSLEDKSILNAINDLGYTNLAHNQKMAKDLWTEELGVEFTDTGDDYGNYKIGDSKIRLSDQLLGGGKEGSAKLAAVMSHEGTHYYGNRIEGIAHLAVADTYSQINQMFKLEADSSFGGEIAKGILNLDNWKENTGDIDHWKFVSNGEDKFGWQWDDDFDFNVGDKKLTAEAMKGIISGMRFFEDETKLASLGLNKKLLNGKGETFLRPSIDLKTPSATDDMFNSFSQLGNPNAYFDFMKKSETFADASIAAISVISAIDNNVKGKEINSLLSQMSLALYTAQGSGLLVKNEYGPIDETGLVETNGCFVPVQLGPGQEVHDISTLYGLRMLYSEKTGIFQDDIFHTGIDLRGIWDSNVVSGSNSSSFNLKYENAFGLRGINSYSDYDHTDLLSHLEAEPTIKAFFSNFGKEGVSIGSNGALNGIKKGTVLGNVGDTGLKSNGAHLDWNIVEDGKNIPPLSSSIFGDYLATSTRTYEATTITGLPFDYDMKSEDAYNRVKSYYNWAYTNNRDLKYAQKLLNSYTTKYADEIWKRNLRNGVPGYMSKQ